MSSHALAPQFESAGLTLPLAGRPRQSARPVMPSRPASVAVPVSAPRATAAVEASIGGCALQPVQQSAISLRRRCVDVVLVTMWAALIPGLMWIGHYAGF